MTEFKSDSSQFRKYYEEVAPRLKERRTQAYFMVILSLFSISFFGFFAIRPTVKTIATLQKQIEDRTYVDQQLEVKINALIAAQEEYRRVEPFLPQMYALLPEKPEVTSLLLRLENQISDTQATISAIAFEPVVLFGQDLKRDAKTASPAAEKVSNVLASSTLTSSSAFAFTITFTGSYADLVNILRRLTALDRLVTIETADFRINDIKNTNSTLTIGVRSEAYYYPLNEAGGAVKR